MTCCRGAAQGEGLGNAFLANITAVDGIFHVLRTFEDPDITHVEDRVDPVDDMHIIHAELRAKDIERVQKFIDVRLTTMPHFELLQKSRRLMHTCSMLLSCENHHDVS